MKSVLLRISLIIVLFSSAQGSIFLQEDTPQNKVLFNSIINTSLKNLSPILKQNPSFLIKKLKKSQILVKNENQTIVQIALANAKEASVIVNLLIKDLNNKLN